MLVNSTTGRAAARNMSPCLILSPERALAGRTCTGRTTTLPGCLGMWWLATTTGKGTSLVRTATPRPTLTQVLGRTATHIRSAPYDLTPAPCLPPAAEVAMTQYLEGWVFPSLWYTFT